MTSTLATFVGRPRKQKKASTHACTLTQIVPTTVVANATRETRWLRTLRKMSRKLTKRSTRLWIDQKRKK